MLAVSNLGFCFRIKQTKMFLCFEQQMIILFDWFGFTWFAITTRKIKYDPNIAYFLATFFDYLVMSEAVTSQNSQENTCATAAF